jgi:hypothetical protein
MNDHIQEIILLMHANSYMINIHFDQPVPNCSDESLSTGALDIEGDGASSIDGDAGP